MVLKLLFSLSRSAIGNDKSPKPPCTSTALSIGTRMSGPCRAKLSENIRTEVVAQLGARDA